MELIPPVWATDAWVDDVWADGSWSTELAVVYSLNLGVATTRGLTSVRTTQALNANRSTEAI
jgi:hypothetical protein